MSTLLSSTLKMLVLPGKGILAADESTSTITKRFEKHQIACTEENRRAYRSLLTTAPGINEFISGVILYEETLTQKTNENIFIPQALMKRGMVPGIKVDKGLINLPNTREEKITQGLDGLPERLAEYKQQGALFAKWREVFTISANTPSSLAIEANAEAMARYATICQTLDIVPIVEPEILMDGEHDLMRCKEVTENVLKTVFQALHRHHVILEAMILKPSMVIAGQSYSRKNTPEEVAEATVTVLRRTVPAAVPSINFLSGGQSSEQATANLQAINAFLPHHPWHLSFSYGRALQDTCLTAWKGNPENINAAQKELLKRAQLNSAATRGEYKTSME